MDQDKNEKQNDERPYGGKEANLAELLRAISENAAAALRMLGERYEKTEEGRNFSGAALDHPAGGMAVEGVFNGKGMHGSDGREYPIPANYASKSKLVEGDVLKLSISAQGAFVFKQIGPVERERLIGRLVYERDVDEYAVIAGERKFRVLKASITFFHGAEGDQAVILAPKAFPSRWAAVENIIKRNEG